MILHMKCTAVLDWYVHGMLTGALTFALQRGGDLPAMGDLRLVERLSLLISGGPKKEVSSRAHTPRGVSPLYKQT